MKTLIMIFILLSTKCLLACTTIPLSFCQTTFQKSNDLVVSGTIIEHNPNSIRIKITDVLQGIETRDTITIWDGTDFDCNGLISMKAIDLGEIGQFILVILPKVENVENTWDVIGDYRRPDYISFASSLPIINDTIKGPVNSLYPGTFLPGYYNIKYSDFITFWNDHNGDCSALAGKNDNKIKDDIQFMQESNSLTINSIVNKKYSCELISSSGNIVSKFTFESQTILDLSYLPGLYIVRFQDIKGNTFSKKIIITN